VNEETQKKEVQIKPEEDDEDKDEIRKEIDKNSLEENEEDLDKDLEGFIDREFGQSDNDEIKLENEILARKKF
jgi:hypothetical protein